GADQQGGTQHHLSAAAPQGQAQAGRHLLAQAQRRQQGTLAPDQKRPQHTRRQQPQQVVQPPLRDRSQQPEDQLLQSIGIGCEVQHDGQGGTRHGGNRQSSQDDHGGAGR